MADKTTNAFRDAVTGEILPVKLVDNEDETYSLATTAQVDVNNVTLGAVKILDESGVNEAKVDTPTNIVKTSEVLGVHDPMAGVPAGSAVVLGANSGTAAQAATDVTGGAVGANKVFQGSAHISVAAQNPAATATGSVRVTISWVPGTGGTAARVVAASNLELPASGVSLNGVNANESISVPVVVYAGTADGKFQATVTVAGVVTGLLWDVVVNGAAQ